jgi:Fe-S-cluster containining protein
MPETFDATREIQFECKKGISCWNACCSNIDISLTPYDILRLKGRLEISSTEFLQQYTVPYELEMDGIAGVKLRPVDEGTACRFMRPEGCDVYEDRPTACRYYPVALLSMRKQDEFVDRDSYALVKEDHCRGHLEPRRITIADYRKDQGVDIYDELARGWRQLILKKKSSGPTIGKPTLRSRQLFFIACYDIDQFRAFVSSEAFNKLFVLSDAEKATTLIDDGELLQFAFRFLRQVLFGEATITLEEKAATDRREKARQRQLEIEREAAERIARNDQDIE